MIRSNTCLYCKKEWQSVRFAKFCGSTCNHLHKYWQNRAIANFNRVCLNCDSFFIAQKITVKYCSHRCNNSHWFRLNPGKHAAKEARRRAQKLNATPPWLDKEQLTKITEMYENCPKGYTVDHIVPLQGKEVKGLHVPWNLQYLTSEDNSSKSNRVEV